MNKQEVVYDSLSGGHHSEYVAHLLRYWPEQGVKHPVHFVLHPKTLAELEGIAVAPNFELVALPQVLASQLEQAANHKEHLALESDYLLELAARFQPTHWLWLTLDPYRTFLANRPMQEWKIRHRGILFMNHLYLPWKTSYFKDQLAHRYKLWRLLRNPQLEKIYVLNDKAGSQRLNKPFRTDRFAFLADPVSGGSEYLPTTPGQQKNLRNSLGWPIDRNIALLFGALSPRKNALGCLAAAAQMPVELQEKICLIIHASVIKPASHEDEVRKAIASIRESHPALDIRLEIGRLNEQELESRFAASDLILAAYLDFYSSSGVMNHAIRHAKNFLIPARGLMANLSDTYGLGKRVRSRKPEEIARSWIASISKKQFGKEEAQRYLSERTEKKFSQQLKLESKDVGA